MRSTRQFIRSASLTLSLLIAGGAQAALTVIDFDAVALRGSNLNGTLPVIAEYANGNGASIGSLVPGQKAYYGTGHFGGATISSIETISFTYRPSGNGLPYLNLGITNGSTEGILALGQATLITDLGGGNFRATYDISAAVMSGFYERVGPDPSFGTLEYTDIDDWTFITGNRTPNPGEFTVPGHPADQPRGPIAHSMAIVWGDSANNYLGEKEIFDVRILAANGDEFAAGVPEPGSLALGALALASLMAVRRRREC